MPQISDILEEVNPWWKGAFSLNFKEREIYDKIRKFLSSRQIIALTGLRRVGKTTLMLKIVSDYIDRGFDPKRIIYFSFDEMKEVEIRAIIKEYERIFGLDMKQGKYLLLLDEIQKLNLWQEQLKHIYDTYSSLYNTTKIIISGSESLFIRKKAKESLTGRIFEFEVEPLSFREFLNFKEVRYKPEKLYERELKTQLELYTKTQGFPELIEISDYDYIRKYILENIIEKIIYRDIPTLFNVENVDALNSLLRILTGAPGQLVEYSSLAKDLGISRQSVAAYLDYLEHSFLVRKLYNYSGSTRSSERSLKKYYTSVIAPELSFRQDDYHRSIVFEWLVINQLKPRLFWRDPYKHEVDCILKKEKLIPIEVKYGKIDYGGLVAFSRRFSVREGYVISSNIEEEHRSAGIRIIIKPAYKFLLQKPID